MDFAQYVQGGPHDRGRAHDGSASGEVKGWNTQRLGDCAARIELHRRRHGQRTEPAPPSPAGLWRLLGQHCLLSRFHVPALHQLGELTCAGRIKQKIQSDAACLGEVGAAKA